MPIKNDFGKRKIRTYSNDKHLVFERRKEIMLSATKAFVKKGYDRTSITELAEAFGTSKGGLYHYIGSKQDILYLILDFTAASQQERFKLIRSTVQSLGPTEALRQSIQMYFEGADELQDMYNFLNHVIVNLKKRDREVLFESEGRILDYFETLLKKGVEAGEFRVRDPRLVAHNIVLLANAWANRRWFLKKYYSLKDYIDEETELILSAIRSPATTQSKSTSRRASKR